MLTRILSAFDHPKPAQLPEPDAKLALGALMVRVAKSDHEYKFEEISSIDQLLGHMNGLKPVEAAKMRAVCEKLEAQAPATKDFAHLIRESVSYEARLEAHEALWQVMLADGVSRKVEMQVILQSREALGLSEADCQGARDKADSDAI